MRRAFSHLVILGVFITLCGTSCRHNRYTQKEPDVDSFVVENDRISEPDTIHEQDTTPTAPRTTEEVLDYIAKTPHRDRYEAGIIPQMAVDAPEYAGKLLLNEHDGFLIVDKNTMKLYRYNRYGVEIENVGIACSSRYGSKHKRRDNRTPEGYFTIEGIYDSTDWLYTDDDGITSQTKGQFGPRFMRLNTPVSSQIGIHGTCAPWSIGGRRSHGCIRMTNENILRFAEICKPGWPVIVSPGPKDMKVNEEEGYDIPSVSVAKGRMRCSAAAATQKIEKREDIATEDSPSTTSDSLQLQPSTPSSTSTPANPVEADTIG